MAMSAELRQALWRTAEDLADVAAARSLPLFRSPGLAAKQGERAIRPVTEADRDRSARCARAARRAAPEDGILGEEFPPTPGPPA